MPRSKGPRKRAKESTAIHIPMEFEDAVKRILQAGPPPDKANPCPQAKGKPGHGKQADD